MSRHVEDLERLLRNRRRLAVVGVADLVRALQDRELRGGTWSGDLLGLEDD